MIVTPCHTLYIQYIYIYHIYSYIIQTKKIASFFSFHSDFRTKTIEASASQASILLSQVSLASAKALEDARRACTCGTGDWDVGS